MSKFKVGDKIKALSDDYMFNSKENGWEGIITESGNGVYLAKITNSKCGWLGQICHIMMCDESDFKKINSVIVITEKEGVTTAILKEDNKEIKRAVAKCNPSDTYDFQTGAEVALKRLSDENYMKPKKQPKEPTLKVGDKELKVGDKVYFRTDLEIGEKYGLCYLLHEMYECIEKQNFISEIVSIGSTCSFGIDGYKQAFFTPEMLTKNNKPYPYLEYMNNEHFGIIGYQTKLKTTNGLPLHIGDVVAVYDGNKFINHQFVAKDKDKCFVMGIKNRCQINGKIDQYEIYLIKKFNQVKNGETNNNVTAIIEE